MLELVKMMKIIEEDDAKKVHEVLEWAETWMREKKLLDDNL